MESALPQPTSFSEQVLSMTSFPPAYLFTVAITSITLLAISGASPAPLAIENARRRTGNALRATTDSERIAAERELRRELKLSLQRRAPGKRSKAISTSAPLSINAAPSKCCTQNPRYETTKRLRKALDSANSSISENAFAAFRDRLLLSNKIWAQERELKGITGDKVPIADIKEKVETRDAGVQAELEEDTEKLGVNEKVIALVQSIADDLTASQREVLALQSQLARYDQTMGEEYNEWVGENERLRAELDGFKERAGVTTAQAAVLDDEYSEVGHSSDEGDGLEQTMVVDESFGRPIPLYTHLEGAEEDFDDADSLDGHSDSGSDSSTSTIAEFDGDYLIDEDEDYFSSARKMYSLENSKASPSPTTFFQPMQFPPRPASPLTAPLSRPTSPASKLPRRLSRHRSLHNPNPVFIIQSEPPAPLKTCASSDDMPIPRRSSSGKLRVIERVRKLSGSLGAVVTGKSSKKQLSADVSASDKRQTLVS
jgi:hypothetical protein